jgi:hypothetical protein
VAEVQARARRHDVLAAYAAAERALRRRGHPPREGSVTPRQYARRLAAEGAALDTGRLLALAEMATRAAYAGDEIADAEVALARRLRREVAITAQRHQRRGRAGRGKEQE